MFTKLTEIFKDDEKSKNYGMTIIVCAIALAMVAIMAKGSGLMYVHPAITFLVNLLAQSIKWIIIVGVVFLFIQPLFSSSRKT